jgi:primosomal protein N' (replication factor Y)
MTLVDVVFPTNLPPLTYICPDRFADRIFKGALVSAPVRGKIKRGVVYSLNAAPARGFILKELSDIHGDGPVLGIAHMELLAWMTDYYFSKAGLVLDAMLPGGWLEDETPPCRKRAEVKDKDKNTAPGDTAPSAIIRPVAVEDDDFAPVREAAGRGEFSVFLLTAPTTGYEFSYVLKSVEGIKAPLVLFPETHGARRAAAALEAACGAAPCIVRGDSSKSESREIRGALTGAAERPIAGGFSAVLAPASWKPSLIVVTREHSRLYKHEGAPRFSARDVAVMRGFIEKIPVLLTSITPSASSWYNAKIGKYATVRPGARAGQSDGGRKRPSVRVVNMRGRMRPLSSTALEAIAQAAANGRKSLVFVNRKGFSAIKCPECGHMERCPRCGGPLMLHEDRRMRCTGCRGCAPVPVPETCPVCRGPVFDSVGAGTERIEALIKERLAIAPMRIDREVFKTARKLSEHTSEALKNPVVVGTRFALKEALFAGHFHVCVLSDADMYLNIPDFFAVERLFQDAMRLSEFCADEGGRVFIQTRNPSDPVFGFLKGRDVDGFMDYELGRRREMTLPPYSKMARVTVFYSGAAPELDVSGPSNKAAREAAQVEIMGPIESRSARKGFGAGVEVVVKAGNSALLAAAINKLLRRLPAKTTRTDIDVDPVGFY